MEPCVLTPLQKLEREVMLISGRIGNRAGADLCGALRWYRQLVQSILEAEKEKINSDLAYEIVRNIEWLEFECEDYAPITTDVADQQGFEP